MSAIATLSPKREIAETFRSLAIAAVAINEIVGPTLFELGLDRARETQSRAPLAVEAVGHASD